MTNYSDRIAKIEEKIAQEKQRLRDLQAREAARVRKEDARRKILYGSAFLAWMERLPEDKKSVMFTRVHLFVHNEKDRKFLGLPPKSSGTRSAKSNSGASVMGGRTSRTGSPDGGV